VREHAFEVAVEDDHFDSLTRDAKWWGPFLLARASTA